MTFAPQGSDGSPDTFIGGGTHRYLPVDDEVPPWLRTTVDWAFALAGLVGGLGGLLKQAGGLSRAVLPYVIGPQALADADRAAAAAALRAGHELPAHWRRVHFRMQPHGPASAMRKALFIAPTVVRADKLPKSAA